MSCVVIDNLRGNGGGGSGAELIGTYSGNQTVDVSEYIRPTDTVDNFIVEVISISGGATAKYNPDSSWIWPRGYYSGITPSKSLSGNTLTLSNMTGTIAIQLYNSSQGYQSKNTASSNITYKVWHV